MSMKHFWLGSALEFSTKLFFCQVCDGACFYTQCHSCASGKVLKSEDVYSPCQSFLILIFTTVATFSESPETCIYSFEFILLTVFAIHGIYFVGNTLMLAEFWMVPPNLDKAVVDSPFFSINFVKNVSHLQNTTSKVVCWYNSWTLVFWRLAPLQNTNVQPLYQQSSTWELPTLCVHISDSKPSTAEPILPTD